MNPAVIKKSSSFVRVGGEQISLTSDRGAELVEDLTRWTETLFDDKAVCSRWDMSDPEWQTLKRDPDIVRQVRRRKIVREATGITAREAARAFFNKAPKVLHDLMADTAAPGRTRIDAARELRQAAGFGEEETRGAEKFSLTIIVGETETVVGGHVIDVTPGPHNLRLPPEGEAREASNFTSGVTSDPFEFDLEALEETIQDSEDDDAE